MKIDLVEEPITAVAELARIPKAFKVDTVFEVTTKSVGFGVFLLLERKLDAPYVKDYDATNGEGPTQWAKRFDISLWGPIGAYANGGRVGAAVVAVGAKDLDQTEGRNDLAVLWDIRILPRFRKQGVGSALFRKAEAWARTRDCRQLKVETQNVNVPACRFHQQQGCVLGRIDRIAYPEFPDEIQLLWYKDLTPAQSGSASPNRSFGLWAGPESLRVTIYSTS